MLYLRTGSNGSCKTLFTLQDVRKLQLESGRPVAFNGRFKLKPEKQLEFGWTLIKFEEWEAQPDGTIFLIDECHNDIPKRAPSAAVPRHVSQLAEHRARGFDFFLLTQHPSNIDVFVRKLIGSPGWHQHLKRVFGASNATRVLQWDAVNEKCEQNGSGKAAQISTRVQPKEVFAWYTSAELHTGKRQIPKQVFVLVGCLLVVVLLGWYAARRLTAIGEPKPVPGQAVELPGQPVFAAPGATGASRPKPSTPAEYVASYTPRIASLMHTAPAYDELTRPRRVPVPAACVESKSKGCKCYTQDATPYPADLAMCRQLVANGAFLAFQPEGERADKPTQAVQPQQRAQIELQQASGLTVFGGAMQAATAPVAVPEPQPQRVASVRR